MSLLTAICTTGTLVALYRTMNGGVIPGGMTFSSVWQVAVTWATAASIRAPGWKYTRITPTPVSDWLSTCSMSFTAVVSTRSVTRTSRLSTSSGGIPLYCQTMVTTGTSASGNTSVAIRFAATTPSTAMRTATTTNVYVRRSARRTIHTARLLRPTRGCPKSIKATTVPRPAAARESAGVGRGVPGRHPGYRAPTRPVCAARVQGG